MTELISLILLGIIQGITEFLPVSSSGHLSLFQYFSKDLNEDLSLNIAVHVGTLFTIIIYYRKDLMDLLMGVLQRRKESLEMVLLIIVASVPTAIMGLLIKKKMGWVLTNPLVASLCLLITALILFVSNRVSSDIEKKEGFGISWRQALVIGLVQGFAVLPGISRSGSTIVTGLFLKMDPHNAARFSFLISLPAIAGAGLLEFLDLEIGINGTRLVVGAVISFFTGLVAISWMVKLTLGGRLKGFSLYLCFISLAFLACYALGWGENII